MFSSGFSIIVSSLHQEKIVLECCSRIKWDISPSLRLLLKMLFDTDVKKKNRKIDHHDGELIGFSKKVEIKTPRLIKKNDLHLKRN